ncbi:unnamed protein product [Adineta ricciae]|uniref:EF-hand domain-containing protein n=1 Tax=Adineta ricciae TaxID=249248 RepID=A0A814A7X2_ADIRI|nr:unnamed protein product [Adineta ricciae]CAF1280433.1 unnamed protein product [Adineta ricciae]
MAEEETPRFDDNEGDNGEEYSSEQLNDALRDMYELFSQFKDNDNIETIHINRLMETLQAFGRNPSQADCNKRIRKLEEDGKFELTFEDLLQLLDESWTSINNDRDTLRQAFAKFDRTKHGFIDIEHFRTVMRTLGEPLTDDEIDGLIQLGLNDEHKQINIEHLLDRLLGNEE